MFSSTRSFVTGSNELMVPGRVVSSSAIPQGALSEVIHPESLRGQVDVSQISVGTNSRGILDLDGKSKEIWSSNVHWARAVRLSEDCHSYNLLVRLQPSRFCGEAASSIPKKPKLVLQTVKPVEVGQELLLWFSEDILAVLQVAFLTPANIQGQKKYVCTKCSSLYESPNPLKLHITLNCGKYSISTLWERLVGALEGDGKEAEVRSSFTFSLIPETRHQKSAIDLTTNTRTESFLYKPYSQQPSAFKPFRRNQTSTTTTTNNFYHLLPFSASEDQAQIETLVSSLGKSKQGHVCLYCGKCYSRKYGLKIHIRTHTGYKPLKCKFCLRPFGDPSNLNKHVRLHAEGDTPYKCELCGKVLVRRRDLERHLKSRHMSEMHPGSSILEDSNESVDLSEEEVEEKHKVLEN